MMSGPNSPNLNPLYYQVWEQCWSLNTNCNRTSSRVLKCTLAVTQLWHWLLYREFVGALAYADDLALLVHFASAMRTLLTI